MSTRPTTDRPKRRVMAAASSNKLDDLWVEVVQCLCATHAEELWGLYIEDVNALRSAALPFTKEVGWISGAVRSFELTDLERHFEQQAARIRKSLMSMASLAGRELFFEVVRGNLYDPALLPLGETDLLVLPQLVRGARPPSGGVMVLDEDSPSGEKAREVAQSLASAWHTNVSIVPRKPARAEHVRGEPIPLMTVLDQAELVRALVMTADLYSKAPFEFRRRLAWLPCPVIIVG